MKIFLVLCVCVIIVSANSIKYENFLKELQVRNPRNEGVLPHHVYAYSHKKILANFGNLANKTPKIKICNIETNSYKPYFYINSGLIKLLAGY